MNSRTLLTLASLPHGRSNNLTYAVLTNLGWLLIHHLFSWSCKKPVTEVTPKSSQSSNSATWQGPSFSEASTPLSAGPTVDLERSADRNRLPHIYSFTTSNKPWHRAKFNCQQGRHFLWRKKRCQHRNTPVTDKTAAACAGIFHEEAKCSLLHLSWEFPGILPSSTTIGFVYFLKVN